MNEISIVMYHYVRDIKNSKYPKIKGLEMAGFRRQLDYFGENFNIISAENVIDCVRFGEPLPKKSCLLTFDDGYKDHLTYVLPELLKRNIQGSFFPPVKAVVEREILNVNRIHFILASTDDYSELVQDVDKLCLEYGIASTELVSFKNQYAVPSRYDIADVMYVKNVLQHVLAEDVRNAISFRLFLKYVKKAEADFADELYLSLDETKLLVESGMYVGSHGYRHLWLEKESVASQSSEIDSSLKFLKNIGAWTEDWIMCYPSGSYNVDTLRILKERKCIVGLTTEVGLAKVSCDFSLELPRFDTNDFPQ